MKYLFISIIFILTSCSAGPQEPGEKEMKAAAEKKYLQINHDLEQLAADCRNQGSVIVNPIKAFKCTSVCALDTKECKVLPTLEMVNFKKLACEKANGQPGFICDYRYEMTSPSKFVIGMFEKVYGKDNLAQARFFQSDSGWIMVQE